MKYLLLTLHEDYSPSTIIFISYPDERILYFFAFENTVLFLISILLQWNEHLGIKVLVLVLNFMPILFIICLLFLYVQKTSLPTPRNQQARTFEHTAQVRGWSAHTPDLWNNYENKSCSEENQYILESHCLKSLFVETVIQYCWFHQNVF